MAHKKFETFKNSNLHAYDKVAHTHTHLDQCLPQLIIKLKQQNEQITWKWHHMHNVMAKNRTQQNWPPMAQPCLKAVKVFHKHAHIIIGSSLKMFSNANSLPRLNVEVVIPIIHMHLYPNYKPTIKTIFYKKNVYEI